MTRAAAVLAAVLVAGCTTHAPVAVPQSLSSARAGTVLSSGSDDAGQLGRPAPGGMETLLGPVSGPGGRDSLTGASGVAAGARHSLAVLADGRVAAWGADDHGQLGNGSREGSPTPVFVRAPDGQHGDLRGAVAVRADTDFSMALLRDGSVVTWGRGNRAQRGNGGTSAAPLTPTRVVDTTGAGPLHNVVQIAADGNTELALLRDGTVVGWGNNDFGQLGPGATKRVPVPVRVQAGDGQPLRGITGIAVGGQHSLALRSDGHVLSWGRNDMYQLGDGSRTDRAVPGPVRGSDGQGELTGVAVIAAAEKHSAALLRDGTVVTWGNNTAGQLGAGTRGLRTWPVTVVAEDGKGTLGSVTSVSVGEAYSVAVRSDGDVLTWGSNSHGQLGSADPAGRSRPGPVDTQAGVPLPLRIVAVGTGQRHLLLLTR